MSGFRDNKEDSGLDWTLQFVQMFHAALVNAFTYQTLKRALKLKLDKRLDLISTANSFASVVDDVMEAAELEGWLDELVIATSQENPRNPELIAFVKEIIAAGIIDDKNFPHLQPELKEIEETFPGICKTTTYPDIWVGVPKRPKHLFGRDKLIEGLVGRLTSGEKEIALVGPAGVGLTALAVTLAHHREVLEHIKDGVLWASLGLEAKEEDVARILNRWADTLCVDVSGEIDLAERKRAIENYIGPQRSFLIIISDAWDFEISQRLVFNIPNSCHLLTTKDRQVARQFAGADGTVHVPPISDDDAIKLLQVLAPEAYVADQKTAEALARAVGGLPLALVLLGSYLGDTEKSMFPELSQKALGEMMDPGRRLGLAHRAYGNSGKEISLEDTIALNIEGLRELENGTEAEQAFYSLGAFAPDPELFSSRAAVSVTGVDLETLSLLVRFNLLDVEDGKCRVHRVVAEVAKTNLDESAVIRHRDYYLKVAKDDPENWRQIEEEYGQIKWSWASIDEESCLDWIWALRHYQSTRGLLSDYIQWHERGLKWAKANRRQSDEATLLVNLGWAQRAIGQQSEALGRFEEALTIWRSIEDVAGEAATLNNIGVLYRSLDRLPEALVQFEEAIKKWRIAGDRAGEARTLWHKANVIRKLENSREAVEVLNEAIALFRDGLTYDAASNTVECYELRVKEIQS